MDESPKARDCQCGQDARAPRRGLFPSVLSQQTPGIMERECRGSDRCGMRAPKNPVPAGESRDSRHAQAGPGGNTDSPAKRSRTRSRFRTTW